MDPKQNDRVRVWGGGGCKGEVGGGGEENSVIYVIWIKLCILPP